jgi:hypothetical protein
MRLLTPEYSFQAHRKRIYEQQTNIMKHSYARLFRFRFLSRLSSCHC